MCSRGHHDRAGTEDQDAARVRGIGEFELIRKLETQLPSATRGAAGVGVGIGDDAAIWTPEPRLEAVITTDTMVEGVHFRLDWTDWSSLGHKLLAVNLSDLAAMGARPRLATVALALTGDELIADLEQLYQGMGKLAEAHGVVVAGGDVVRSPYGLMLTLTAIGEVDPDRILRRSGARPGELIVVSGTLGASAAGLALLGNGQEDRATTASLLVAAHLRPMPRIALGRLLGELGATSAMDLSDGLLGDLPKLLEASGASGEIDLDAIPILPAVRALFPDRYHELALRGGEDYELLFTIDPDGFGALRERAASIGATVTTIGRITAQDESSRLWIIRDGQRQQASEGAFDHFG